ncbi:MAG TPA: sugar phosphate isomerase/epimerase family protein [Armatimonadota bacterium]|nr:sugar phosphate isomerase/epimerase family protein [Armatimonadota bacterium]
MTETIASTQLYVWTQVLARTGKSLDESWDTVLAEVKAAGYPAFEGFLDTFGSAESAAKLRSVLEKHALKLPSVYTGGNLYDPEKAPATVEGIITRARVARDAGVRGITMNPDVLRERKTADQLRTQAEWLNRLGAKLRELQVELWIHNHDPEMKEEGRELRYNLDHTDPRLVRFCADTHWIWRGGGDPYAYLEQYGDRLGNLHLRNSRNNVWSEELGEGDLDHRRIARILKEKKFSGPLIVELAIEQGTPQTRPLVESQKISRAYLKQVFGV